MDGDTAQTKVAVENERHIQWLLQTRKW